MPQLITTGSTQTAERVRSAIANASARTGVDFDYLFNQARIESALKPDAKAKTSSAQGLYQFTRQTWLATVKAHGAAHGLDWAANAISQAGNGHFHISDPAARTAIMELRNNPEAASVMAAEFASDNEGFLGARIGRAIEPVDLYLAHFLGAGGAARFLSAHASQPDAAAAPLFPKAAAANRGIFYGANGRMRTLAEIRDSFAAKLGVGSAGNPMQTPSWTMASQPFAALANRVGATAALDAPRPLEMRTIEPMPERLSLDFAHRAYQRLANMGGGRDA